MASTPVSFTVRRPTPSSRQPSSGPESSGPFKAPALPRHLASSASSRTSSPLAGSPRTFSSREESDDDEQTGIVFSNGSGAEHNNHHPDSSDDETFVATGGQRFQPKKKKGPGPEAPLVIPSLPNPDWREAAQRRRTACSRVQPHVSRAALSFVPGSAFATTGADGSVGGLGTRDTINSGPQLSGLQMRKKVKLDVEEVGAMILEQATVEESTVAVEETEDRMALRAILSGEDAAPDISVIPIPPLSEADALKQDVRDLPDVATADDYERVPISAFGAAMLRGMGWTDGIVAPKSDKRSKNGLKDLYLPQARPALLGIGAKEQELEDDGSGKKKTRKGPDMRYVPVARKDNGNGSSRSATASRRSSRSPFRRERDDRSVDRERGTYEDRERRKERDRDEGRRSKNSDDRDRERKAYQSRDRDADRDRGRGDSYRDRERDYNERERTTERDRRDRRDDR